MNGAQAPEGTARPVTRLAVLIHGDSHSIESVRARQFTAGLPADSVRLLHRDGSRLTCALRWHRELRQSPPDVLYVVNTALPGAVLAPWWSRRRRRPFLLDTGDAVHAMARDAGTEPSWRLPLLQAAENLAQRTAATVVVRGSRHQDYLRECGLPSVELIRDGYLDAGPVAPASVDALRTQLRLPNSFVVGVLGSLVFSPRLGICYGWDLIAALALLRDLPVHALIIGDGNGLPWLRDRARTLGVEDRCTFAGRVPYEAVQPALRLMDVALSTQTNNLAGQVRTTGKLPEYMAAGRFILASRVGDATVLLPEPMLVDFEGTVDPEYPRRLANRIRDLVGAPATLALAQALPSRARALCSYPVLRPKFERVLRSVVPPTRRSPAPRA